MADIRVQQYRQELSVELASNPVMAKTTRDGSGQRELLPNRTNKPLVQKISPIGVEILRSSAVGADVALEYMRLYADLEVFTKVKALIIPVIEQNRQISATAAVPHYA